jgi:hypothetical protein
LKKNLKGKLKEYHDGHAKGFYFNRAFGSNRYYCVVDGDINAGVGAGQGAG